MGWPPARNDCLRAIDQPFFTPIYDFIAPRIVSSRVALVGDAASNPRPHMGFGVSKAGCDAQALANEFEAATAFHLLLDRRLRHGKRLRCVVRHEVAGFFGQLARHRNRD